MSLPQTFGIVSAIGFGMTTLSVLVWLGASMIVPQSPIIKRTIAGGISILFLIGFEVVVGAIIGFLVGWIFGKLFEIIFHPNAAESNSHNNIC